MQVDYIIVGIGLAGISFCEQLNANGKTFVVFDNASQQASLVAGGLYNPVVLKRFTPVWKNKLQLEIALKLYKQLEQKLKVKLDYKIPVYRKFASLEEQNDWFVASDKPSLSAYLSTKLIKNKNQNIGASFGFGEVLQSGRIDTQTLIKTYKSHLKVNNLLFEDDFVYEALVFGDALYRFKNIKAKYVVFAEGFGVRKNPFFNNLPLVPTKGELLTIHAPDLKIDFVLKAGIFLIPLKNDLYTVGATYHWEDITHTPTKKAKEELLNKLNKTIKCQYKVVNHIAGIRPTVKDRRPLVGTHKTNKQMFILNGLGTRGVMIAPYIAQAMYNFIEKNVPLEIEIDIKRFE